MEKKRILHLITGLELGGGAENMLLQMLPKMQNSFENRICVIKGGGEIALKLEKAGIKVYYLDLSGIFDVGAVLRYRNVLKEFAPDVQVDYLIHADIFGRVLGKLFRVKKVVSYIRNIHRKKPFLMALDRLSLPLADFVLTNSEAAKKYYISDMGVKEGKIRCIPNGIEVSRFHDSKFDISGKKCETGIPKEGVIIGSVARLEKQKDIPTLVSAFNKILKSGFDCHLLLVGHGSQEFQIKSMIDTLNLGDKVTFLKKRSDMPEIIKLMDIFVLPSLNEGMSNGLLEAMASSRMIIASDIPENQELIENKVNGIVFRAGDPDDLFEKISGCLNNLSALDSYRKAAFESAKSRYDINKVIEDFVSFLSAF